LVRNRSDFLRHGKHHMKIFHRQQLGLTILQPLVTRQRLALGAMAIPAAVVRNALVATGIALFNVAA
jgi:hypothetical protein